MDHAVPVREVEGGGDRAGDAERLIERQLAVPLQALTETLALDVGHHVIEEPVRFPGIDECENVRVLELCREADLSQKPLGAEHGGKLGPQHLERDRAVVLEISGEVDRGHAAAAKLALDRVAVGERCLQTENRIDHRRRLLRERGPYNGDRPGRWLVQFQSLNK